MQQQRRLAAILFTDIVASTAVMQKDEQAALALNKKYVAVLKQCVAAAGGEILNDYGDGSLCTFHSATEALRCAMSIQQQLQQEPKVPLRIGLHSGEIFFDEGKVYGDAINVASRVQSLGIANSVLFSSEICSKIKNQQEFKSVSLGKFHFKNVDEPLEVFALTNTGFAIPDKKKIEGKLKEQSNKKKSIFIGSIVLALLLSFVLYNHYSKLNSFTGENKSIAVLPFENISSDKDNEYINDGFTIDIINKIYRLSDIASIPGWARVKIFKNSNKNLSDIAAELGVAALLNGTIQKQGDKLRITAELTDVNTGKTIWSIDDNRKWGDVLTVQNEVAEKIASSLSAQLTQSEENGLKKEYTQNAEAYNYYLRGRYFSDFRTPITYDSAEVNYKKAIDIDPDYALAYSGLADLFTFNQKGLTQLEAIPIARDFALKALSLDSNLAQALTTIGFIQSAFDYNWKDAKKTLEKALALNSGYTYTHIFYGNLLLFSGEDTTKGLNEVKKALTLDPLSVSMNWIVGRNYYYAQKYAYAEQQLRRAISINSKYPLAKSSLAWCLLKQKKYAEAFEWIKQVPRSGVGKTDIYQGPLLSYAYSVSGNKAQGKIELEKTLQEKTFNSHDQIATAYVALEEYDKAFEELEKSYKDRELYLYFIKVDPLFDPIKNDERFKSLLKKMNLN